jgi:hypothetical protein
MSAGAKASLADLAFKLRDEQLEARIVHYRADLQTNAELDAITANVVMELQALQKEAQHKRASLLPSQDQGKLDAEIASALSEMLSRVFRKGKLSMLLERKLAEVSKRFARLFFRSELHERLRAGAAEPKTMRFAEQAVYYVFARTEPALVEALESMSYADPALAEASMQLLAGMVKDLRDKFLSRTTPELNELIHHLQEILHAFLSDSLPPLLPQLAEDVTHDASLGKAARLATYKVSAGTFPHFRAAFEQRFLQILVPHVEEAMLARVRGGAVRFRRETLAFVADPRIFSDVCELICDCVYDALYSEGFLDLPADWRAKMTLEG